MLDHAMPDRVDESTTLQAVPKHNGEYSWERFDNGTRVTEDSFGLDENGGLKIRFFTVETALRLIFARSDTVPFGNWTQEELSQVSQQNTFCTCILILCFIVSRSHSGILSCLWRGDRACRQHLE